MYKDIYTGNGFAAVGNFSFSVNEYLKAYLLVFAFIYFTSLSIYILRLFLRVNLNYSKPNELTRVKIVDKKEGNKYSTILVGFLFMLFLLNSWMYSMGIGITGINPPALPFRLSGILYFLQGS
jgi:hypothetical protein